MPSSRAPRTTTTATATTTTTTATTTTTTPAGWEEVKVWIDVTTTNRVAYRWRLPCNSKATSGYGKLDRRMKKRKRERLVLAHWGRRVIAWFVDYLIVNVMLAYVGLEQVESVIVPQILLPRLPGFDISIWSPISVLVFFIYWTLSSWYFGRSIGQLLVNNRVVGLKGKGVSLKAAAVQSLGKSLLLPLDCAVGWIYRPCRERRQRLFNRLSNTIVIYIGQPARVSKRGEYDIEP